MDKAQEILREVLVNEPRFFLVVPEGKNPQLQNPQRCVQPHLMTYVAV